MHRVARLGLARTFQETRVFASDTVAGNIERARMIGRRDRSPGAEPALPGDVSGLLEFCGIAHLADLPASVAPFGTLRQLGIAMALASGPSLLLLDEPAAGLNGPESNTLAATLRRINGAGVTLLVVDHDMEFIMPLVERLIVLTQGRLFREGSPDELHRDPDLIAAYLGSIGQASTNRSEGGIQ